MRVFVTGASGVMGRSAVSALVGAGHEVRGLVRSRDAAEVVESLGAEPITADLYEPDGLADAMSGCHAVANLATKVPVGRGALRPGSLRQIDRIRIHGSRSVASAALQAGVGTVVQQSLSFIYADAGDSWIDEDALIDVSRATEPVVVAEDHLAEFAAAGGRGVSLRYGLIVGRDPNTEWQRRRAAAGRSFALGDPQSWMHVVHPDDIGSAVVHALDAPSGHYNVGAEPVRRGEFARVLAEASGGPAPRRLPGWVERLGSDKLEILTRSNRVSSRRFTDATGWTPRWPSLSTRWLTDGSRLESAHA